MSWPLRCVSLAAGLVSLALLGVAAALEPAADGYGTHQQLGLPPCTSIVLFDAPCPACGMTTSWSRLLRGQLMGACDANLGGALLAIIALAYIPASCYFFFTGAATRREWFSLALACALVIAMLLATAQWLLR